MINEKALLDALHHNELIYYYQPKVSLINGKVVGAEALLRWKKPDGSIILPADIIPFAEQTGIIKAISYHMFSKLVCDLSILLDIVPSLVVSFNVTPLDFEDAAFYQMVLTTLAKFQINPKNLQIELTESMIMNADSAVKNHVFPLCKAGIGLAMDDYGVGYSTLDALSLWPFTTLKLDKSLISRMLDSRKNLTIVESSIRLAHELDIQIVAEGVESNEQYQMLMESGCTKVQGFWISKPLPLDQFIYFMQQDLRWSAMPIGLIHMAVVDHIQWRKQLVSNVVHFTANSTTGERIVNYPSLCHTECRLGKWYYGLGQEFRGCEEFDAVEIPHQTFHTIGKNIIEAVNQGASMAQLTELLSQLSLCSAEILNHLQKLENKALMEMHNAHYQWQTHKLFIPGTNH